MSPVVNWVDAPRRRVVGVRRAARLRRRAAAVLDRVRLVQHDPLPRDAVQHRRVHHCLARLRLALRLERLLRQLLRRALLLLLPVLLLLLLLLPVVVVVVIVIVVVVVLQRGQIVRVELLRA